MTVEELEIVIKAKVGDALNGIKQVVEAVKGAAEQSVAPMQKIASQSKQIGNQTAVSVNMAKNSIRGLGQEIQITTAQQQLLNNKINDLKATLSIAEQDPKLFSKSEVLEMRVELEKLEAQLIKTQSAGKTTSNMGKYFESAGKSVKRFLFNLLRVGSIFALIARAMATYLQTNEQANASWELTFSILGNLLAPVMQLIIDLVQYMAIGMALLIKMFTGYNALAKVTTKNLNKATKAADKLNKSLTSMDEIENLQEPVDENNLTADANAFADFADKVAEVEALFERWNIQSVVDDLKTLAKWLWDNKEAVMVFGATLLGIFAAGKVSTIVSAIGKIIGSSAGAGTGLVGLLGSLGALGQFAVLAISVAIIVTGVSKVIQAYKELKKLQDANKSQEQKNYENLKMKLAEYGALKASGGLTKEQQNAYNMLKAMQKEYEKKGYDFSISGSGGGRFATGTVAYEPTYGLFGEYQGAKSNPEIVAPQDIMRQTMLDAFSQILPSIQTQGSGDVVLNINGKEFAKAVKRDMDYESNRVGTSTVMRRV